MPTLRAEMASDLALKIVALAEEHDAEPSVFFTAMGMAYLSSIIAMKVAEGHDVEEADLARAIKKFTDVLCDQASWLMNVQPHVLKHENINQGEA